jgi:tRNA pseudouridine55 synthase
MGRRNKKGDDINGWIIIDKDENIGSTDIVNITRRLLNANKNGHAGTLDPFATGVLPIAFGEATKAIPYVTDRNKKYEFIINFGIETNTDDNQGIEVKRIEKYPNEEEIKSILPKFIGEIEQTPPDYSAIKINGERAYKLAREGKEVDIPSRKVKIFSLDFIEKIDRFKSKFIVECSKGTYVRTLGKDIAKALGSTGHLSYLRRTKCGVFDINNTITLDKLKELVHISDEKEFLLPITTILDDILELAVSEADAAKLKLGQSISPKSYPQIASKDINLAAATYKGKIVAFVGIDERKISPIRVLNY